MLIISIFGAARSQQLMINDTWFTGEGENNGRPIIIRGRQHLKNLMMSERFSSLVEVIWNYKPTNDSALPTPDENVKMGEFEDKFVEVLEADLQSVLTLVYTHNGQRTWILYTQSAEEFEKRFSDIQENLKLSLAIEKDTDPDWTLYRGILENFGLEPK